MKPARILSCSFFSMAMLAVAPTHAAKQDETEGISGMSGQSREIYRKTDKKAAARPGQTVHAKAIAPIKGAKGEEKVTKGEETAGTAASTAPAGEKATGKK